MKPNSKFVSNPNAVASAAMPMPQGCTNLKLRQLTRRVSQHYDAYLSTCGLKTTQYSLLSYVVKLGPLKPSELARHLEMDPSTLSRNLQPLVAQGWLVISAGENARSRLIEATVAGQTLRTQAAQVWKKAQLALNQKLGLPTVVALHDLLDQGLSAFHETEV